MNYLDISIQIYPKLPDLLQSPIKRTDIITSILYIFHIYFKKYIDIIMKF